MTIRKQTALLFFDGSTRENGLKAKDMAEKARGHGVNALLRDFNHYGDENENADLIAIVGSPSDETVEAIKKRYGEDNVQMVGDFPDDDDDDDTSPITPLERTDEEIDELAELRKGNGGVHGQLGRVGEGGGVGALDGTDEHDPAKTVIPDKWREMSWAELRSLASSIKGVNVTNKTDAVTTVEDELKRRTGDSDDDTQSGGESDEVVENGGGE